MRLYEGARARGGDRPLSYEGQNMPETMLSMSDIARAAGLKPASLRYHFRAGNVPEPKRRGPSGTRLFSKREADRTILALAERRAKRGI